MQSLSKRLIVPRGIKLFSKIKSITKLKYKKAVFDITGVPETHNFIANNMVVHNCDEAVRFAATFDVNKVESKELKKLFTVIRPRRLWIFFNIPQFQWIETKYREAMSSFWLRMIERGTGVVFEKNKGEVLDHYSLKEMEQIMGNVKFFTPMEKIKRNLMRHPCYFDMFKFPELDQDIYDEYELVRNAINLQEEVREKLLSNKDLAKIMSYQLLYSWDRIIWQIKQSRENKMNYNILLHEILCDPLTRQSLVSDVTVRNWCRGVQSYLETRGQNAGIFGGLTGDTQTESKDIKQEKQESKESPL